MIRFDMLTGWGQRVSAAEAVLPLKKAAALLPHSKSRRIQARATLASALRKRYTTSMTAFSAQEHGR